MQTFLPYQSYVQSSKCLDRQRLGKQRVECKQIFKALTEKNYGWKNHPAVKMWRGYEGQLLLYAQLICLEWQNRGYKDQQLNYFTNEWNCRGGKIEPKPEWLTLEFCESHQSNLLRKDFKFYSQFGWNVPDDLPYIWPVQ